MKRNFIPGSEWLYFKIYTGCKSSDRLLIEYLYPFVNCLLTEKMIHKFFFIRYADPDTHVRIRLHVKDMNSYSSIFKQFYEKISRCVDSNLVTKVMCDTYQREIERYGNSTIEFTEELFYIDSVAIIKLLELLETSEDYKEEERWLLSIRLVDDILNMFGYASHDKELLISTVGKGFKQEHGFIDKAYIKQLDNKFRDKSQLISQIFEYSIKDEYKHILREREEMMSPIIKQICILNSNNKLDVDIDSLVSSYMHMTMNRLFRSKARTYEMVIYHFMDKYYHSEVARVKYKIKN